MIITYLELFAVLLVAILPLFYLAEWSYLFRWHRPSKDSNDGNQQGKGIDVTPVSTRLQQLRQDYTPEVSRRPHDDTKRQAQLTSTREAIKNLSFFQRPITPEHLEKDHESSCFVF
ncbi:MAG: hypothetical protein JWQ71_3681 [Pedosphaera sp.]|nr:hypothetical protein [Pedosphaera sp.]